MASVYLDERYGVLWTGSSVIFPAISCQVVPLHE